MPSRNEIRPISVTEYDLTIDLRRKKVGGSSYIALVEENNPPKPTQTAVRNGVALSFRHVAKAVKAMLNELFRYHRTAQYHGSYPGLLEGGSGIALATWYQLNFQTGVSTGFSNSMVNGAVQMYDHSAGGNIADWRYVAQRDEDVRLHAYCHFTVNRSPTSANMLETAVFFRERNSENDTYYLPLSASSPRYVISGGDVRYVLSGGCLIRLRKGDSFCIKLRDYGDGIYPTNAGDIIDGYGYISIDTSRVIDTDTIGMIHEPQ